MSVSLILGGARSGKSRRAEELATETGLEVVYVATARRIPGDLEWAARIEAHQQRRSPHWYTVEEAYNLTDVLQREERSGRVVLVDCLTLWLSNWLLESSRGAPPVEELVRQLGRMSGPTVIVSNEVGSGVVPTTELGRRFRDAQGDLNRDIASRAARVEWMVAGVSMIVKSEPGV